MSITEKIEKLQAAAALLEASKSKEDKEDDSDEDMEGGKESDKDEDNSDIEDEDETKASKKNPFVKESFKPIDLGALFEGTDLSEEFKTKAITIFEAAVAVRVAQEVDIMEEELAQRAVNESAELKEGLVEKIDGYLDYMVEQWMQSNEIALERGIKAEIFESFVGKMRDVFVEHNITLPDEEFDLVESLQAKTEALEEMLDESVAQNVELNRTLKGIAKQIKIDEACKNMTDMDAEKFALLAEEISFDDEESFAKKLDIIRENYVVDKAPKEVKQLAEDVTQGSNDPVVEIVEAVKVAPNMSKYLTALNN